MTDQQKLYLLQGMPVASSMRWLDGSENWVWLLQPSEIAGEPMTACLDFPTLKSLKAPKDVVWNWVLRRSATLHWCVTTTARCWLPIRGQPGRLTSGPG